MPAIHRNDLRDTTVGFLIEVCHNVRIELTGEHLTPRSATREDGGSLDIAADNFWERDWNRAFFDVRV